MQTKPFPVIDLAATGENILRMRQARGLTVRDMQAYFGFEEPQSIYKWQRAKSLPTVDNLYALSNLLEVPMNDILVPADNSINRVQQAEACCSAFAQQKLLIGCQALAPAGQPGLMQKTPCACHPASIYGAQKPRMKFYGLETGSFRHGRRQSILPPFALIA